MGLNQLGSSAGSLVPTLKGQNQGCWREDSAGYIIWKLFSVDTDNNVILFEFITYDIQEKVSNSAVQLRM
jgi:hypothetical protein